MGATRSLTDKPITPEVVEEDGRVVAAHLTTVITDPDSANAVRVPSSQDYPSANQTDADPLAVHSATDPAEAFDDDETATNEVQRIDPTGTVSGGTYDFVLLPGHALETAFTDVAYNATPTEINALIVEEPDLVDAEGNPNVVASGAAVSSGNLDFTFSGADVSARNLPELTVDDTNITGGGSLAAATVTAGITSDG